MDPYEAINEAFEKKLQEDSDFREKLGEGISASLEKAGLAEAPLKAPGESLRPDRAVSFAAGQVIRAKAFWWGYHFVIPESAMDEFTSIGNVISTFMALGGSVIAASGGSLAPVVAIVAAYAAAELAIMQAIDQGKGVYLSASWVSPALIVPTPI